VQLLARTLAHGMESLFFFFLYSSELEEDEDDEDIQKMQPHRFCTVVE